MSTAPDLADLFVSLFDSEGAIRRFVTLINLGTADVSAPDGSSSSDPVVSASRDLALTLERLDLVSEELFLSLEEAFPDRRDDIFDVAYRYGIVLGDRERETARGDDLLRSLPADDAAALRAFADRIATSSVVDPAEQALAEDRWPWTAAAAVLGEFRPSELRPLGAAPVLTAAEALVPVSFATAQGTLVLEDPVRLRAIRRLESEGRLESALAANDDISDARRDLLWRLRGDEPPRVAGLSMQQLRDAEAVTRWLHDTDIGGPDDEYRALVLAAIERRAMIEPLSVLVGTHFRGRERERTEIASHVDGDAERQAVILEGPGGVGKSSLIGKVLLDLEAEFGARGQAFAYLDIDQLGREWSIGDVVERLARQLRLLYATNTDARDSFIGIEAMGEGGSDFRFAARHLDLGDVADWDGARLIRELARRIDDVAGPWLPPLVLVVDTLEEAQALGPGRVEQLLQVLEDLWTELPRMQVVLAGRGTVPRPHRPATVLTLGDLDPAAADDVLEALGVAEPEVRELVVRHFGANPLTLKLAAEALRRTGSAEAAFGGVEARADVLADVAMEQVQGILYSRILGHLDDPEVIAIALPGLVVRVVDVDVIREVLAGPCGIDPDRAPEIYERLRRQMTLFTLEPGTNWLRHRADVRRLMLRTILDQPAYADQVRAIHRAAIDHFSRDSHFSADAEVLYHRLMLGEDPRTFPSLMTPEVMASLRPALDEPLPPVSRRWLLRRMGRASGDDAAEWDQLDWELEAGRAARSWLAAGRPAEALDAVRARPERLPLSTLDPVEVAVLTELGRFDEAQALLERSMEASIAAADTTLRLPLAQCRLQLAQATGNEAGIVSAAQSYARIADLDGAPEADARHLLDVVEGIDPEALPRAHLALSDLIVGQLCSIPVDRISTQPDLVRRAVQILGPTDGDVLAMAASVAQAQGPKQTIFRSDPFVVNRLLDLASDAGGPALGRLASDVGLPDEGVSNSALASGTVRAGRIGDAVLIGTRYAADSTAARRLAVDLALPPTARS